MEYTTKPSDHQTTSLRLSDIHTLISGRYDGPCRTANAERYLMIAVEPELKKPAGLAEKKQLAERKGGQPKALRYKAATLAPDTDLP